MSGASEKEALLRTALESAMLAVFGGGRHELYVTISHLPSPTGPEQFAVVTASPDLDTPDVGASLGEMAVARTHTLRMRFAEELRAHGVKSFDVTVI